MALSFSDNIGYSGSRNNFERDYYATIADMVAVKKTKMPTMFIAMCGETGKAYLYNKSNEFDETLGLWRELGGGITDEEKKYIANDVLVVKEALEIMFNEGHKKLTIGSCCLDEYNKSIGDDSKIFYPNMYDIKLDEKIFGSIHLTPGRCYHDADNGNISSIHWDLVAIGRSEYGGSEIYFDDEQKYIY